MNSVYSPPRSSGRFTKYITSPIESSETDLSIIPVTPTYTNSMTSRRNSDLTMSSSSNTTRNSFDTIGLSDKIIMLGHPLMRLEDVVVAFADGVVESMIISADSYLNGPMLSGFYTVLRRHNSGMPFFGSIKTLSILISRGSTYYTNVDSAVLKIIEDIHEYSTSEINIEILIPLSVKAIASTLRIVSSHLIVRKLIYISKLMYSRPDG